MDSMTIERKVATAVGRDKAFEAIGTDFKDYNVAWIYNAQPSSSSIAYLATNVNDESV